ncbi:DUF3048 domain-containing protein [Candidatus Saccharibacteria bacterium]|nr:DUF3048 domain-containing protein [Candidatus Saccharibacteria bacterium]
MNKKLLKNDEETVENSKQNDSAELSLVDFQEKTSKTWLIGVIIGAASLVAGITCLTMSFLLPPEQADNLEFPIIPSTTNKDTAYSDLTGMPIDPAKKNSPTYCIQVPNGTDGARPQSGLNEAGVIFEAIAEAGITRFAAIFQDPSAAVIGPIRSLRLYYLEWDTPFDCTIVHAGGADDALRAVASGGYSDLTENYAYMYRGTYRTRLWNNLFTTPANLNKFSVDTGKTTSNIKVFARMTPEESVKARVDALANHKLNITEPTTEDTSKMTAQTSNIGIRFGGSATFNVNYVYNTDNNTYTRSYGIGPHEVYSCPNEDLGERNPEDVCNLTTMSPSVVVAMVVSERRASDNYHEDITTIGSGDAYIFQNGTVIKGTWNKASRADQIRFLDPEGKEIKLAPGQTIVSAVPNYGGIDY